MKLNKKLNMVVPVDLDDGSKVYVHATPISREVFETYFENLSRVFTQIYAGGHGITTGPRIAYLLLKKDAVDNGVWESDRGVRRGLIDEIRRLTNVLHVAPGGGWQTTPFEDAVRSKMFNDDDEAEILNVLVYFTLASAMHRKAELRPLLEAALSTWGARPESSNCMEFRDSLPTSTLTDSTGERVIASSIPS